MSNYRKNSFLNLIFNYSNIVFNLITGVFLVPLYLLSIPLDVYGSFLVAAGIAGLIGLLEFGLSMVVTQRLAKSHAESEWVSFRLTTYSGFLAASLLTLLVCLITVAIATHISLITKVPPGYENDLKIAFILLGLAGGFSIYLNLFGAIFQALLKAGTLGMTNIISAAVGIAVVVVWFSIHPSLVAIAGGTFARVICATLLLMAQAGITLRKASLLPMATPFNSAIGLLRACLPIFIGGVSKSIAENTQNLLLTGAASPSAVAVLALTQKALQICSMILAPIGSSIYSTLTQIKHRLSSQYFSSLIAIAIRSHFLLSALLIATASQFNKIFMSLWVGQDKFGGVTLSMLLGVAMLLTTRFSFFSFLIYSTGEFKKPLILETSYSITKCVILYATVKTFGLYAIPMADITAGFIFLYFLSTRLMIEHVAQSSFGKGIYYRGWAEFATIGVVGFYCSTLLEPHKSWIILGTTVLLFSLVMLTGVLLANAPFVRDALQYSNVLKRSSV